MEGKSFQMSADLSSVAAALWAACYRPEFQSLPALRTAKRLQKMEELR
jgi:hypothetical protein